MIPQTTVLFTGMLAVLASIGVLDGRREVETRIVLAVFAMLAWAVYAFGMFDLGVATGAGDFRQFRLTSQTFLGAISAAIMLLFALDNLRDLL